MDDLSEKEQIDQIRGWWSENGSYVIAGIVLGVGSILGYNYWQSSQVESRVAASTVFESLTNEVADNDLDGAEAIAAELWSDHGDTIYADQARLAMARLYMDQGRDQDAAGALRSLIDSGNNEEMQLVARLRLAKIYLYQGRPEEVAALLDGYDDSGFAARYLETIGDARYAMGEFDAAEEAYLAALEAPQATQLIDVALVQMKIADMPDDAAAATPVQDTTEATPPVETSGTEDEPDSDDSESSEPAVEEQDE